MRNIQKESDGLGVSELPAGKLLGAQPQRSLELTARPAAGK
jgi:hypothetical protein